MRDERGKRLNTLNQRILRAKKKQSALSEESPEYQSLQQKIASAEEEKSTLFEVDGSDQERGQDKVERVIQVLDSWQQDRRERYLKRLYDTPSKEEEDRMRKEKPLAPLPPSKKKISIFRSGVVAAPEQRGVEKDTYLESDEYKPEGRTGRTEGIFCSPTLSGVTRWVRGNHMMNSPDYDVREITVDPDKVYVYSIERWETASAFADPSSMLGSSALLSKQEIHNAYWDSGMTLRQWYDRGINDGEDWEILLSPEDLQGVKNVSPQRVANSLDDEYYRNDVLSILKMGNRRRR